MNQLQFLAITQSCVHGVIGFGLASHWLKKLAGVFYANH